MEKSRELRLSTLTSELDLKQEESCTELMEDVNKLTQWKRKQ
jgi:hypothetical protein